MGWCGRERKERQIGRKEGDMGESEEWMEGRDYKEEEKEIANDS